MPDFTYTARDCSGQKVSGTIAAAGPREAMTLLAGQSLFPMEIRSAEPRRTGRVRRVPAQLLATSYSQLADLLRSGVPLLRSLEVIQKQSSHAGLRRLLQEVHDRVEDGATLAEAMGRYPEVFGEMALSMVRAGGEGGFLEEALTRVAEFTETQQEFKSRTIGAVVYPVLLVVVGTAVVTVLVIFFVPRFGDLFGRLRERGELPLLTDWLLWLSGFLRRWGIVLLAAAVAGLWALRRWLRRESGRRWWDGAKLRLPVAGSIFRDLAVARFARALGTLLRNGVPLLRALEIARDAAVNRRLAGAIAEAAESVSSGAPLSAPLSRAEQFPVEVIEMIAVAEQANTLESVLLQIAEPGGGSIWPCGCSNPSCWSSSPARCWRCSSPCCSRCSR